MIQGIVQDLEPLVRIKVHGKGGRVKEIVALVDTGYTSFLSLPPAIVASLGLTWDDANKGTLADGSECIFDVYQATVVWDGKPVRVFVDELDGEPLLGMGLLNGYELRVEGRPRGKVTIKRLR